MYWFTTNSIVKFLEQNQLDALISEFIFGMELHMFRTVSLSIIRSPALYTQQYIQVMLTAC